jgi:hypothetical protein
LRWNTWHAEKRIPANIKDHFGKARFAKSLKTESLSEAISLAEPFLKQWYHLIEMARLKNKGHIVDLDQTVDVNATKDRSKGIRKRFGYLKRSLGFKDKIHVFHSFRSTLASRFQDAGVSGICAARVLGHAAWGMIYGLCAGDLDFVE